ncbi:molybdopterin cofactor-binding domain-containing protein [Pseudoroseomonas wenyumeiae]
MVACPPRRRDPGGALGRACRRGAQCDAGGFLLPRPACGPRRRSRTGHHRRGRGRRRQGDAGRHPHHRGHLRRALSRAWPAGASSATARWNADGTLDLWLPNQAPEVFQRAAAQLAGLAPEQVRIHSPLLGGFFGRHFLYDAASPFPQAIQLAKAVGRPVKLIWSREEEFLRDGLRPMGLARFRAGLDADGLPVALEAEAVGEGPPAAGSAHGPAWPTPRWWRASPASPTPSPTAASAMCR